MTAATGFLSLPRLAGHHQLRELAHQYGGEERLGHALKIDHELMSKWLSGQIDPPYYLLVAAWFASPLGFQQAFSESHWANQENTILKNAARRETAALKTAIRDLARSTRAKKIKATLLYLSSSPDDERELDAVVAFPSHQPSPAAPPERDVTPLQIQQRTPAHGRPGWQRPKATHQPEKASNTHPERRKSTH